MGEDKDKRFEKASPAEIQEEIDQIVKYHEDNAAHFYDEGTVGEPAMDTGNRLFDLANRIGVDGFCLISPLAADEHNIRAEASSKIEKAVANVYQEIIKAAKTYAANRDTNSFNEYCRIITPALRLIDDTLGTLGMEETSTSLSSAYGAGSTTHIKFTEHLRRLFDEKSGFAQLEQLPAEGTDPRTFLEGLIEEEAEQNKPRTRTHMGLGVPHFSPPPAKAETPTAPQPLAPALSQPADDPVIMTGVSRMIPSVTPPADLPAVKSVPQKTETGLGKIPVSADNPGLGQLSAMNGIPLAPRPEISVPPPGRLPTDDPIVSSYMAYEDEHEEDPVTSDSEKVQKELIPDEQISNEVGEIPPSGVFTLGIGESMPQNGNRQYTLPVANPDDPDSPLIGVNHIDHRELGDLPEHESHESSAPRVPTILPRALGSPAQFSEEAVTVKSVSTGTLSVPTINSVPEIREAPEVHEVQMASDLQPAVEIPAKAEEATFIPPSAFHNFGGGDYQAPYCPSEKRQSNPPPAEAVVVTPPADLEPPPFTEEHNKWVARQKLAAGEEEAPDSEEGRRTAVLPAAEPIMPTEPTPSSTYLKTSLSNRPAASPVAPAPLPIPVAVPPAPIEEEEPAPFTKSWAARQAAQNTIQNGTVDAKTAVSSSVEGLKPAEKVKAKSSGEEESEITPRRSEPPTPEDTQTQSRSKLWRWAGAGATALGLTGLFGGLIAGDTFSHTTDSKSTAAASASASSKTAATPPSASSSAASNKTPDKPATVENQAKGEKGIYRIDVQSPAFQGYLCHFKGASMLSDTMKKVALATQVGFNQNLQERQTAQKQGKTMLVGNEDENSQRLALLEAYLNQAQADSTDNYFIKNYFRKQKSAFEDFKATGVWSREARAYAVDKLYDSLVMERLVTSPEIIGFAPVVDSSNWKQVSDYAPAFAKVSQEAARRLHLAGNVPPFNDPRLMKVSMCDEIQKIGKDVRTIKSLKIGKPEDVMAGIHYMYNAWCKDTCPAFVNPFEKAIRVTEPVKAEKPQPVPSQVNQPNVVPNPEPLPGNLNPAPVQQPQPKHTWFKWPWQKNSAPDRQVMPQNSETQYACAAPEKKPGLLSRAVSKVKEFFGFGGKVEQSSQSQYASTSDANWSPFIMDDTIVTPKQTWKETLKEYFWG